MKHKISLFILLSMILAVFCPTMALADVVSEGIPQIDATSYIVVEGSSGEILFGHNVQQQVDPASITKIMTAVLAIEKGNLDQMVTVGKIPTDMINGTTQVYLREGEKVKMSDLLKAAIVVSANDAAYVIGDAVGPGKDNFVKQMNDKAKALGMNNTTFSNAHGLTEAGHLTTAEDMAILGRYAMSLPQYREIAALKTINWQGEAYQQILSNGNTFLDAMPEATGVKNGYTEAAKNTLVGAAKKDGRELIGVVLGSSAKSVCNEGMKTILNYGFEQTKVQQIIQKDMAVTTIQFGEKKEVRVVSGGSYGITRLKDDATPVTYETKLKNIDLPINKGDVVGGIEVMLDGRVVHEVPLLALDTVRKPINWWLIGTGTMTVLYLVQMLLRVFRSFKRKRQSYKKMVAQVIAEDEAELSDDYKRFVDSLEHPKNKAAVNRHKARPSGEAERPRKKLGDDKNASPSATKNTSNRTMMNRNSGTQKKDSPRELPRKY